MKHKTVLLLGVILLFLNASVSAQEIQLTGSAYLTNKSRDKNKILNHFHDGLIIGFGYQQYLSDTWSLGIGIAYLKGQFHYKSSHPEGSYNTIDGEGDAFEFRYQAFSYTESEKWHTLRIPLTVQFETGADDLRWYIRTGPLIDLAIATSDAKIAWQGLQTSGFYEQWDAVLTGPKFVGFGDLGNQKGKGKIQFENVFRWEIETGLKTTMGKHRLYIGAFFDLGLNDFRPKISGNEKAISYIGTGEDPLIYNSVWTQEAFHKKQLKNNLFGIRLRYGINWR